MNTKLRIKIMVDLGMSAALPLLMAQALIGEKAHEWIGTGMFVLVFTHNILNLNWYKNLLKGRYTAFRIFQSALDISILLSMIGQMISGIMLSRHVFAFLQIGKGISFARTLHMLSAYWIFILMMVHLGCHANMMMSMVKKATHLTTPSKARTIALRTVVVVLCGYGIYAFVQRQIGSYMFLQSQFVFFDFREPIIFFFIDYVAIMVLFVCVGHYFSTILKKFPTKDSTGTRRRDIVQD